jgi:hypothetical protein
MIRQDCHRCRVLGSFWDHVLDLFRRSPPDFVQITAALYQYVDVAMRDHFAKHDMEPKAEAERKALAAKEVEVIGRTLMNSQRYCDHHPGHEHGTCVVSTLSGAGNDRCPECLSALVKQARETPAFTPEDAAAADAAAKENEK